MGVGLVLLALGFATWHGVSAQVTSATDASVVAEQARSDKALREPRMAIAFATGDLDLLARATALDGIAGTTGKIVFGTRGVTSIRARSWAIAQIAYLNYKCPQMIQSNFANELDSGVRSETGKFGIQNSGPGTFSYILPEGGDWPDAAIKDASHLEGHFGCSQPMLAYSRNLFAAAVGRAFPVGGKPVVASSFETACHQERAKVTGRVTMGVKNHCSCLAQSFGTSEYQRSGSIERYFEWLKSDQRRATKWVTTCFQKEG
jgi:hypothetical protein